jgi:hypothetical protein
MEAALTPSDNTHPMSALGGTSTVFAAWIGRAAALCPCLSNIDLLCDLDRVVDLDTKVAHVLSIFECPSKS